MKVFIDTDALLGLVYHIDPHHRSATRILAELKTKNVDLLLLPTTLAEFSLMATSRIGMAKTKRAVSDFVRIYTILLPITEELTQGALNIYDRQTSKEESLFDCYIMAAATQYKADCIFSFDRGYIKNGFILIEDFLKT